MKYGLSARAAPFIVGSGHSTPAPRVASVQYAAASIERTISTVSMESFVPPVVHRLPVPALAGISDVPLHFDDGENGMCDGFLLGPYGKPLITRQGLTDAQIMSGKLASVLGLRVNDDTVSTASIVDRHKSPGMCSLWTGLYTLTMEMYSVPATEVVSHSCLSIQEPGQIF